MSAPVMQWQIVTTEPESLAKFYGDLFGWKISANNALGYREIATGSINGGLWPAPAGAKSFVQLFVGVPDVEASVAKAIAMGAKVIVPVTVLPDGDVMAVLADPMGVTFGLMRQR
jgi:predicted enzyme related to lactoylglutathione lyase